MSEETRWQRVVTRLGAGVISQGFSMLTNMGLIVGLARMLEAPDFGRFALFYGLVQIAVGIGRSTTADVAAASFGGESAAIEAIRLPVSRTMLSRVSVAVPALFITSVLIFDGFSVIGLALAIGVIPLSFHELWRQLSFAGLAPGEAVRLDLVWLAAGAAAWLIGVAFWQSSPELLVLAWAFGAGCGAFVGARKLVNTNDVRLSEWRQRARVDAPSYAFEFLLSRGTPEIVGWTLAITAGLAEAGSFRLAQTLLGPLSVLIGGLRGTFVAELRRVMRSTGRHVRAAASTSVVFAALPLGYLLALLFVPESLGEQLIGTQWVAALAVAPYLAVRRSASAASIAPFLLLRVIGRARLTSTVRIVEAGVNVVFIIAGSLLGGSTGALVGFMGAALINLIIWWSIVARTDTEATSHSGQQLINE